jgi:hypothetical protein
MIADLDNLIQRLTSPVSDQELADGWTPEAKVGIGTYFQRQRGHLDPQAVPGLVRGLDAWGISQGELFDEALRVHASLSRSAVYSRVADTRSNTTS